MNRVDIEVTGSNKFAATQAEVNKQLKSVETQATKTAAASKKVTQALGEKPKMDGVKEAEKAVKKLQATADEAFDKVKAKMEESFEKLGKEHETKIKVTPEIDKSKMKSSLDGFSFDVDITKGIGPKIAAALGKGIDLAESGVKGAASFVSGLGDGLKAQHPAIQAAVYGSLALAVLTVGPFLGATLAGGVVAGFGAGIAGIGVAAAVQSDRVRSAWSSLWDEIVAGARKNSGAIEVVLLNTAQRAKTIFGGMKEQVAGAINDVAPGFEKLLDGVLKSIERFGPALRPMAEAASAVFSDLGSRLPDIVGEMADEFADLAEIVKQNPEALGDFVAAVGEAVEQITLFLEVMTTTYNHVRDFFDFLGKGLDFSWAEEGGEQVGKVGGEMTKLGDITGATDEKLKGIEASFRELADAEDDAAKRGDAFLDIMNKLSGRAPTFDEAIKDTNDTIRDLIENFTKSGAAADGYGKDLLKADGSINTVTKNGSMLYDALTSLQQGFADAAGATKELEAAGMSHDDAVRKVNESLSSQAQRLVESAGKMGLNQDQMRELLRLYGLTPKQIDTLLRLDDADFRNRIAEDLRRKSLTIDVVYNRLNAPLTQGTGRMQAVTDYASGGNLSNAASGGVRSREVNINDGPGGYPGEAVRIPDGSTVWPAGMTRMMMQQASQGFGNAVGGGGGDTIVEVHLDGEGMITWMKGRVRKRGGKPEVFG